MQWLIGIAGTDVRRNSLLSGGGDGNIYMYDLEESQREERRVIKCMAGAEK